MNRLAEEAPPANNLKTEKVRNHARRSLWVLIGDHAPQTLRKVVERSIVPKTVKSEFKRAWNTRSLSEGLNRRLLQRLRWKREPPLWRYDALKSKEKHLLLKWYIRKLPITQEGSTGTERSTKKTSGPDETEQALIEGGRTEDKKGHKNAMELHQSTSSNARKDNLAQKLMYWCAM